MSYTKGPLRISGPSQGREIGDDGGDYAIIESGGIIIGEAFHRVGEDAYRDAEANARLWASAPDLVAEVERLRAALEALAADERKFVTVFRTDADSYIAFCNFCNASHEDEYKIEHVPDCAIIQARAALGAEEEAA